MIVKYLFSAPKGDIPIAPDELYTPFKMTPSETHPFLTLGDYFEAIKGFLLKDRVRSLLAVLEEHLNISITLDRIGKLLIRSEKHGALYHLASVEFFIDGQPIKYGVSTAVSDRGKAWLSHEYDLLNYLGETFALPFLPKVYFKGQIEVRTRQESFSMFLAEWFEDYYEWHLTLNEKDKGQKICIWDQKGGHRLANKQESFEIFKQASKILTLYYDTLDYRQIYPWHHAAGDFVVRSEHGKVDVKLTTARRYKPMMVFPKEEHINPIVAIVYFFLNLTIQMRLDKLHGIGDGIWAEDLTLQPVIEGFLEGLKIKEEQMTYDLGKVQDLGTLLKAFSLDELQKLLSSLMDFYHGQDPKDFKLIQSNLIAHAEHLYASIQSFRL